MWVRDWGLKFRMYFTLIMLGLVYLAFIALLFALGINIWIIAGIAVVLVFMQYYYSDRIVLWSVGARIVGEDEAPELYNIVSKLAKEANIPMPKIAIVNTPIPNAFATGRNPNNAVVAVTTGLLDTLDMDEIEAVLGHELSHIKNRDVAVITIASLISMIAFFVMRWAMFMGFFGGDRREEESASILFLVSAIVWFISFLLIRALSRYREFAADMGSAILTKKPRALISALLKIERKMKYISSNEKAKVEGMNAFFIVPAISGKTLMSLFSTHPPTEKRIERLEKIAVQLGL